VPCSASSLGAAISGATSGEVLQLAPGCTYWLYSALPNVNVSLTLQGTGKFTTIERSSSAPPFGLLTVESGAHLTVNDVNFRNGSASPYGGAIFGDVGSITVNGGIFTGNQSGEYGGALYNQGPMTVKGATFINNTAWYGGAIGTDDPASIAGATFTGNTATGTSDASGGAIIAYADTTVNNSTFSGNQAAEYEGGGIDVAFGGAATASQDTFVGNTAYYGGGIGAEGNLTVNGGLFRQTPPAITAAVSTTTARWR
jgi:hypothetical protein